MPRSLPRADRRAALFAIALIILLGWGARLFCLNRTPLRGDEAFTVLHWMRQPLWETLANIAPVDPQPPLAYAAYRIYALVVGSDERVVRLLPALLNTLGIAVLYALGKRIGGRSVGLLAALLWALHPAQIWHAQDARNYALWGAASPLALWLGIRALERGRRLDWALYVAAALAAGYLYYLELFFMAAFGLYVVITYRHQRRILLHWGAAQVVIGIALALWYAQPRLLVSSGYGGTAGGFAPLELLTWFIPALTLGEALPNQWRAVIALPIFAALIGGVVVCWRKRRETAVLLILLVALPLLLISLVSLRLNVFVPRYVLPVSAPITLLLAILPFSLRRSRMPLAGAAVLCLIPLIGLWLYWFTDYTKAPDWRSLTAYLSQRVAVEDVVVQTAADEAFTFYYGERGIPAEMLRLPANPYQPTSEIEALLVDRLAEADTLWVVAQANPAWDNAAVVPHWLSSHAQILRATTVSGLPAAQWGAWTLPAHSETPLAVFSDAAQLLSAAILPPEPTGSLYVWLDWHPLRQTETSLKAFVHLVGDINPATGTPLWSQDDQPPQEGRADTTAWMTGVIYRDVYELPLRGVPAGTYRLQVGLYDPESGMRTPVGGEDMFDIGTITLP